MKIQVDLSDILHNERGDPAETLAEAVRRQVVETLAATVRTDVQRQISEAVAAVLDEELRKVVADQMPGLVADLLDASYQPVSRYGERAQPTTMREQLIKTISEQMQYKRANYDSDKNAFTRAVDEAVKAKLEEFRKAYNQQVDGAFITEALNHATNKLRERLGLPK